MTDVSAEQRQRAKTAAANIAVAANDAAVVLGAAGLIVAGAGVASGVGALAGVGAGAALGVCSFGAWFVGNRYQRLANDPPRDDFDQVTISAATLDEGALPAAEPDATVTRVAAQQIILADAVSCLVTSLERFDGAQAAGDAGSASTQADAAGQNASAVTAAREALRALADPLNQAWTATRDTVDWSAGEISQAQRALRETVGDPAQAPGEGLRRVLASVSGLADPELFANLDLESHPLLTAGDMPAEPDALLNGGYLDQLDAAADPLRNLIITDNA
jgi:hypothetical protein